MRIFRHSRRKKHKLSFSGGATYAKLTMRPRKLATKLGGLFGMQQVAPSFSPAKVARLRNTLLALELRRKRSIENNKFIWSPVKPKFVKIKSKEQICRARKARREVMFAKGKGTIKRKSRVNRWLPESRVRCN